jgi:dienelactone hydrolase
VPHERPVRIPTSAGFVIDADLVAPPAPVGIVAFAHGSGSSRHSRRNRHVAAVLQRGGLATLLLDLLTPEEEAADVRTGEWRFDIPLLGRRTVDAIDWLGAQPALAALPVGLFGASTGAAAALVAAACRPDVVGAVVSRGGRPDLAGPALGRVRAPVLLIVGGRDESVLALNREARRVLGPAARLVVVPGATHLFEEAGALDRVARLACDWLVPRLADAREAAAAAASGDSRAALP